MNKATYGAIIGDMVGSIYERNPIRTKDFPFFSRDSHFTDDTVMTVAVSRALKAYDRDCDQTQALQNFQAALIDEMRTLGRAYPRAGYGKKFIWWLFGDNPAPYGSYGNGSAMRVSPVGDFARSLDEALSLSKASAAVTHDHRSGIKGAQAVATAIYLARNGAGKDEIRQYVHETFYDMNFSLAEIWADYKFDASCQGSVPQAIMCFLEGDSFEDVIRNCIWLGGDCDTTAAIAGGIAGAYYGVDEWMVEEMRGRLGELGEGIYERERK
jgi:ADP-ribosylglycohydrolase